MAVSLQRADGRMTKSQEDENPKTLRAEIRLKPSPDQSDSFTETIKRLSDAKLCCKKIQSEDEKSANI